jgi:hypothetical protein
VRLYRRPQASRTIVDLVLSTAALARERAS